MMRAMPAGDIEAWIGRTLLDGDGRTVGVIEETYCNKDSGEPLWMLVRMGRFRAYRRFAPLARATADGDAVRTPRTKRQIDNSPHVDPTHQLADSAVCDLYRHYGMTLELRDEGDQAPAPAVEREPEPSAEDAIAERIRRYTA
jgi:hypothetical protein